MSQQSDYEDLLREIAVLNIRKYEMESKDRENLVSYFLKKINDVTWEFEKHLDTLKSYDFSRSDYNMVHPFHGYDPLNLTETLRISFFDEHSEGGLFAELYFDAEDAEDAEDASEAVPEFMEFVKTHKVVGRSNAVKIRDQHLKSVEIFEVLVEHLQEKPLITKKKSHKENSED